MYLLMYLLRLVVSGEPLSSPRAMGSRHIFIVSCHHSSVRHSSHLFGRLSGITHVSQCSQRSPKLLLEPDHQIIPLLRLT